MDAVMKELFTTDIGLLALFTLSFIVAMGLFLWYRLAKNAHEQQ